MMNPFINDISALVRKQFPSFYHEQGPDFITFVETYYKYLEQKGNPTHQIRNLSKQFDIDSADDDFIRHYAEKYMNGLPNEILGNQRLLQKHILELYRSKGSNQSIRLLFRLLFNEDIDLYVPSYDIFTLSDNTWIQPRYIEITNSPISSTLVGQSIRGLRSGATAVVENYEERFINGSSSYVLYISNIIGRFEVDEQISGEVIGDANLLPTVRGSVVDVQVTGSSSGLELGAVLVGTNSDAPASVVVSELYDGTGSLTFEITEPGTMYSVDAVINEFAPVHADDILPYLDIDLSGPYMFPKLSSADPDSFIEHSIYWDNDNIVPDDIAITGGGAEIKVLSIRDPQPFFWNSDKVEPYIDVALDGLYPFPIKPDSNLATIIEDSLEIREIMVGPIESIQVINPGANYSSTVIFRPVDPYTSPTDTPDGFGGFGGRNAEIIGTPIMGENIVKSVRVYSSGLKNQHLSSITFATEVDGSLKTVSGIPTLGGVGRDVGFYDNTKSFLSNDKYLYDGHYYQDYSYVIRSSKTFESYLDVLKQLVHPAGNAVYGDMQVRANGVMTNQSVYAQVKQE